MLKLTRKTIISLMLCGLSANAQAENENIIIMIGDGMGPAYNSAYRFFKDNPDTPKIEPTIFDQLLIGTAQTSPHPNSGRLTDSAAAATAIATGYKTVNGAIAVDFKGKPLTTIMELAKQKGMATGVVVTSGVVEATPAAFMLHNLSRSNKAELIEEMVNRPLDIMFGRRLTLSREQRETLHAKGYEIVEQYQQLEQLTEAKALALLPITDALDDPQPNRLAMMTKRALTLLNQHETGFVLMVEGSQIDWAGHGNDVVKAMHEMDDFAAAVKVVAQFVRENPSSTMVITADHNTGGMTIGRDGKKCWHPDIILGVKHTPKYITKHQGSRFSASYIESELGFSLQEEELTALKAAFTDKKAFQNQLKSIIDKRSCTGWTTSNHTGVDVNVYGKGKHANQFSGFQENSEIGQKLIRLLPQ